MRKIMILILAFAVLAITGCNSNAVGTASPGTASPSISAPASAAPTPTNENEEKPSSPAGSDAALEAYRAVLENNAQFYSTENEKSVLFDEFLTNEEVYATIFEPVNFAVLDMDGDEVPEVVIALQPADLFAVLHYDDGEVDGYMYSIRQLGQLKADGTFTWSGSASYWGYGKLDIAAAGEYKTVYIGYAEAEEQDGVTTMAYYIDDKSVTEDAFTSFTAEQEAKPDVTWHAFSETNIKTAF